jgi:hypothetical protein
MLLHLMKRHVSVYLVIIRLKSSKTLNIVCVWRILRSHHLAKNLYMRYNMRVSRYGGGRELVCGIVGGGHLPRVLLLLVLSGFGCGREIFHL